MFEPSITAAPPAMQKNIKPPQSTESSVKLAATTIATSSISIQV